MGWQELKVYGSDLGPIAKVQLQLPFQLRGLYFNYNYILANYNANFKRSNCYFSNNQYTFGLNHASQREFLSEQCSGRSIFPSILKILPTGAEDAETAK